jgi:ubiquinone/menaquinone biosynthesis C-methylase UbiE
MTDLSERQLREKEYYEQYAAKFDVGQTIDFSPIEGPLLGRERRPWNSYWRTYEIPVDYYLNNNGNKNFELLDLGCGPGDNSLRFSRIGYKVTGFDISSSNIENCKKLFEKNQCADRGHFLVSIAEKLEFQDASFDIVAGIDILHHVDIPKTMKEVERVLRPGGIAVFREPVEVPFLDWIRNTRLVRFFVPNAASLEAHITEDERKLNEFDFKVINEIFPLMTIERSLILARFDKFIPKNSKSASLFEKVDYFFTKIIPGFSLLGGGAVIILKKK